MYMSIKFLFFEFYIYVGFCRLGPLGICNVDSKIRFFKRRGERNSKKKNGESREGKEKNREFLSYSYHSVFGAYYWICSVLTKVFLKFNIFKLSYRQHFLLLFYFFARFLSIRSLRFSDTRNELYPT